MLATYVPPLVTSMTWQQAGECARWALKSHVTRGPRDEVVALVMAKTALESGRWGLRPGAMKNYNICNLKCPADRAGMFTCFACDEILPGRGRVWFEPDGKERDSRGWSQPMVWTVPPGHPQTRFRAFANRYDGFDQYVSFLAPKGPQSRYAAAWAKLLEGDANGFVYALKAAHYFTADVEPYRAAVLSLHQEFISKLRGVESPDIELEDDDWDRLRAMVVATRFDDIGIVHEEGLRDLTDHDTEPPELGPDTERNT
jgi:hypothetical protein